MTYENLHQFRRAEYNLDCGNKVNVFFMLSEEDLTSIEERFAIEFPADLRNFWLSVGWGFLRQGDDGRSIDFGNCFMHPEDVALFMSGERTIPDSPCVEHGGADIPFMDMADGQYLVLRDKGVYWGYESSNQEIHRVAASVPELIDGLIKNPNYPRECDEDGILLVRKMNFNK